MSSCGMPSVIHTTRPKPASIASKIASDAVLGGTKIMEAFAPVFSTACSQIKYYRKYMAYNDVKINYYLNQTT